MFLDWWRRSPAQEEAAQPPPAQEAAAQPPQVYDIGTPRPPNVAQDLEDAGMETAAESPGIPTVEEEGEEEDEGDEEEGAEPSDDDANEIGENLKEVKPKFQKQIANMIEQFRKMLANQDHEGYIVVETHQGTQLALQISSSLLQWVVRNRKTILGACLIMHVLEDYPSVAEFIPGWNMQLVDESDPVAVSREIIRRLQAEGIWNFFKSTPLRIQGYNVRDETANIAKLWWRTPVPIRKLINFMASRLYRYAVSFVAVEAVGTQNLLQFVLQIAWALQQQKIEIASQLASTAIKTVAAGFVTGPAGAAVVAASDLPALGQSTRALMNPQSAALQKAMPVLAGVPSTAASSSAAPALQAERLQQDVKEAEQEGQPDQRPVSVAASKRRGAKMPFIEDGILPTNELEASSSLDEFIARMRNMTNQQPSTADRQALIEAQPVWSSFTEWLHSTPGSRMKSWDDFKRQWNQYKEIQQSTAASSSKRKGSRASARAPGTRFTGEGVETPETLQLQPKAKAKSRAVGGSRPARPKTKKILLSQPVIPYHDIMNDGYYIK